MFKLMAPALRDILGAIMRRAGTGVSAFLLSHGIPTAQAEQAVLALAVLAGVGFDVVMSLHNKKKVLENAS